MVGFRIQTRIGISPLDYEKVEYILKAPLPRRYLYKVSRSTSFPQLSFSAVYIIPCSSHL